MVINILVEGILDESVASQILYHTGHQKGLCYGKQGFGYIKNKIKGFNLASKGCPILTLVDQMDTGINCPVDIVSRLIPYRESSMMLRVVIPEIESWLLSDAQGLSKYLHVSKTRIPDNTENLNDPKQSLVNIARRSRSRNIREAIVPKDGSTATEGALYTTTLSTFVRSEWNIEEARRFSSSLDRCISSLKSPNQ